MLCLGRQSASPGIRQRAFGQFASRLVSCECRQCAARMRSLNDLTRGSGRGVINVPYRIHREVKSHTGGDPVPEGPTIGEFETLDEAKEFMRVLVAEGISDV
jgi:hypothetical protein